MSPCVRERVFWVVPFCVRVGECGVVVGVGVWACGC